MIRTARTGARAAQRARGGGDLLQRGRGLGEELLAFRGQRDLADVALEQRDAEAFLQAPDLPAHRAVRDMKLDRRARETLVTGRRDEGAEGVERRFGAGMCAIFSRMPARNLVCQHGFRDAPSGPDAPHAIPAATDLNSRHAAIALALALPADTVLYLLLPMYAAQFGVTLAEAGMLLAANRLVRIAGYGLVARFYARHGDRPTCTMAVVAAAVCALGYATLSGFWALLPLRLLWGLCFAGAQPLDAGAGDGRPDRRGAPQRTLARLHRDRAGARAAARRAAARSGPGRARSSSCSPRWRCSVFGPRAGCLRRRIASTRRGASSGPTASTSGRSSKGFTLDGLFIVGLSLPRQGPAAGRRGDRGRRC